MSTVTSYVRLPERRDQLTRAALELLEEHGPEAMTTRKVAQRVGISTMQVYSEFGSMAGLVASVVEEGFARLDADLASVKATDDPIADLWGLFAVYRQFALRRPHLYGAIYSASTPGGYRRSGTELLQGSGAFLRFVDYVQRAIDAVQLAASDPYGAALQLWAGAHGVVMLDLAGYLDAMPTPATPLDQAIFLTAITGLGGDPEAVQRILENDTPAQNGTPE